MIDSCHHKVRPAAVTRIAVRERADERHLIRLLRHLWQESAQLDAGDFGFQRADATAKLDRGVHLGVKCLDVRGTAAEPDPDDGCILSWPALFGGFGPFTQEAGEPQS